MDWTHWCGALGFGAVIGWYLYFINRYRKADVQIGDLTTVIGAIGGAAVLKMFDQGAKADYFGAYGIGIAVGFFGYFLVLVFLVGHSKAFKCRLVPGRQAAEPAGRLGLRGRHARNRTHNERGRGASRSRRG
jgi:hypothetical protein